MLPAEVGALSIPAAPSDERMLEQKEASHPAFEKKPSIPNGDRLMRPKYHNKNNKNLLLCMCCLLLTGADVETNKQTQTNPG